MIKNHLGDTFTGLNQIKNTYNLQDDYLPLLHSQALYKNGGGRQIFYYQRENLLVLMIKFSK